MNLWLSGIFQAWKNTDPEIKRNPLTIFLVLLALVLFVGALYMMDKLLLGK